MMKNEEKSPKNSSIQSQVKLAFTLGCSAPLESQVNASYSKVVKKTSSRLVKKFGLDPSVAEDFAAKGAMYALAGRINGKVTGKFSEDDWVALAIFQAENLAKSHHRRRHEELLQDGWQNDEGEELGNGGEAYGLVKNSVESWRNRELDAEVQERAALIYSRRRELFQKCGVTPRAAAIYAAYILENRSTEDVARKFNMKYEAVQTSACRTGLRLAERGPEVVRALLAVAA